MWVYTRILKESAFYMQKIRTGCLCFTLKSNVEFLDSYIFCDKLLQIPVFL